MLLSICEFCGNRRRAGRTFVTPQMKLRLRTSVFSAALNRINSEGKVFLIVCVLLHVVYHLHSYYVTYLLTSS